MFEYIGWLATAVFTASYFCKRPVLLRRVQAVGALLWLIYGILIHSAPIIVANTLLTVVAFCSSGRTSPDAAARRGDGIHQATLPEECPHDARISSIQHPISTHLG